MENQFGVGDVSLFDSSAVEDFAELQGSGEENLLVELFALYSKTTPALIQKLEVAYQLNKSDDIRKIAHSLKSSSASLGLLKLRDVCAYLEKEATSIVLNKEEGVIAELKKYYDLSVALLFEFIQKKNKSQGKAA